jgi:hypothetical protein
MRLVGREKLNYANAMSTIAVFIALGGTSYAVARNSIGTPQLKNGAVTSAKVKNGTLQRGDLSATARSGLARGPRGPIGPPGADGTPGASATIEAWKPLELGVGWVSHSGADQPPASYRRDGNGIVYLRGLVAKASGAPSNGDIIGTLPAGYRSRYRIIVPALTGNPEAIGRLDIQLNGQIVWVLGGAGEPDYTSLNGISLAADG